jgi:hypothetical protein
MNKSQALKSKKNEFKAGHSTFGKRWLDVEGSKWKPQTVHSSG